MPSFSLLRTAPSMATMMVRIPNSLSSFSLLRSLSFSFKSSLSTTLTPHRSTYFAIASAADSSAIEGPTSTTTAEEARRSLHPWPEWVAFVDKLKSQGYIPQSSSPSSDATASELEYREMNMVKDPCLSFARDRYDIFGSLSKGDILAIVEGGCPKILRKVVNSAKRLRAYVGLDESDVCSACTLRESCDRAYVILKESEQDARTVDLVRILLFYALDPLVMNSGSSESVDPVNSSARRLLRMLTDLSEASPGLAPLQPPNKDSYQKKQLVTSKPMVAAKNIEMKKGDWMCPKCDFMNFARNVRCRECHAEHPKGDSANDIEMKKGDWHCPQCASMNFASRRSCFRCSEPRPPRSLNPGEWECPKCDYLNFRRNITCLKCGTERVKEAVSQYEEQFWIRPQ